ncbi:MAG: hypothetical protein HY703_00410 [Gemmatimonadetes bacterium]|nr:hypothetical protein [Gemmatimonadota bacterium]
MGTAAAPDQPWDGELAAPIGTEAALLRSRLVLVGSAALAGVAVGAIAAMLVSRRS